RLAHGERGALDPRHPPARVAAALDVVPQHVPVRRAGEVGDAGEGEDQARLQGVEGDLVHQQALDAVAAHVEPDRVYAAVHRRVVVLLAGRDADVLRLQVRAEGDDRLRVVAGAVERVQRTAEGDQERRRGAQAG